MTGPVSKKTPVLPAEEYELSETIPESGPSRPRQNSNSTRSPIHPRKLTLNPGLSTHNLLYDATPISRPIPRHRRTSSAALHPELSPVTPRRQFLFEDGRDGDDRRTTEEVRLPDFGQILGFNPDALDDHFAVAQGMRNRWKRQLYLLMEEPGSGREAFFIHIAVTGAILFR
jgi:potassium voltage-gated channel Shal-related subfamily D protein 2